MNCWFCNQPIVTRDHNPDVNSYNASCESESCRSVELTYIFTSIDDSFELYRVQFTPNVNENKYFIGYFLLDQVMEIHKVIPPNFNQSYQTYQLVTRIPYDSLILTPQNTQHRLPILITFS